MKAALKLYHRLPSFIWPLVASLRAFTLKRRRYGYIYDTAVDHVRERLRWPRKQWLAFQQRQLAEVLNRAAEVIPVYQGNPRVARGEDALDVLRRWPLINTNDVRVNPQRYCDPLYSAKNVIVLHTSGSSGTPKRIVRDVRAEQLNYAYAEARWRNTAGVALGDRWIMIGGQLVVPVERRKPPFWVAAYPMNQLYMSSYHLQREFARDYLLAMQRWEPKYMLGYPSSMYALAEFSEETGLQVPMKAILSNAEPLLQHVREKLEHVFKCRVVDTYGSTEAVFQAFECSAGSMHISPDFGVFEILRADGSACAPGEVGRVVATGLTNRAMPLIRYPVGDLAAWAVEQECACGCSFPVLEKIEGREDDVLELPNGRRIGRLDPVFKGDLPIKEAQIVQKPNGDIEVRIVAPDGKWNESHSKILTRELHARVGDDVEVRLSFVPEIPRGANGKFKAVVRERPAR